MSPLVPGDGANIPTILHNAIIAYPSTDRSALISTNNGAGVVTVGNEELAGRIHVTSYNTCHILSRTGNICLVTDT